MPKAINDVLDELKSMLKGRKVVTFDWDSFRELNDIERWKGARGEELWKKGLTVGIVVAQGDNAVIVCRDKNFDPLAP